MRHRLVVALATMIVCFCGLQPANAQDGNGGDGSLGLRGSLAVPIKVEPESTVLDRSKGQEWHRASMQLSGSMCPACLLDLENKLQRISGVAFTKIDRQVGMVAPDEPAPQHRTAAMIIIYDSNATKLADVLHCVKQEKYKPLAIEETVK